MYCAGLVDSPPPGVSLWRSENWTLHDAFRDSVLGQGSVVPEAQ